MVSVTLNAIANATPRLRFRLSFHLVLSQCLLISIFAHEAFRLCNDDNLLASSQFGFTTINQDSGIQKHLGFVPQLSTSILSTSIHIGIETASQSQLLLDIVCFVLFLTGCDIAKFRHTSTTQP
ncbi:unnamed protein product [Lathyrus sativus]|nr:unnamed protein product [Lathyrus sativus]